MKNYFQRLMGGCKKWELCLWWAFRLVMIYAMIKGLTAKPFVLSDPLQVFGNLLGMFAWEIFQALPEKNLFRNFPSYIQDASVFMIFAASFCGKYLNFYYDVRWWDSAMHLISGGLCVILGYEIVTAMQKRDNKTCSLPILIFCALGFSFFVSTCWELFEFTADQIMCHGGTPGDAQHWSYELAKGTAKEATLFWPYYKERWAIMDTMGDIILNTIGAIVGWIILKVYPYHHRKNKDVNKMIEAKNAAQSEEMLAKEKETITK